MKNLIIAVMGAYIFGTIAVGGWIAAAGFGLYLFVTLCIVDEEVRDLKKSITRGKRLNKVIDKAKGA